MPQSREAGSLKVRGRILCPGFALGIALPLKRAKTGRGQVVLVLDTLSVEDVLEAISRAPSGLLSRVGGVTAHGAALIREARIPALTAVDLPNGWIGCWVTLDAFEGLVEVSNAIK